MTTPLNSPLEISGRESHYIQVSARRIDGQQAVVWLSTGMEDPGWDNFLEATPLGQYQQSSLWARAKQIEGWRPLRIILTLDGQIAGGFQILAKNTRFGSMGYISKGPVLINENGSACDFMLEMVVSTVKTNHLRALVLQAPDGSRMENRLLARHQFLANHLVGVNSATLVMDVACGMDEIMQRMRRTTILELKRSQKRGVKMREGGEHDISTFFRLMKTTCERQQTSPSPATESAMLNVWKTFHLAGRIRLALAEFEGEPIAGAICLCFGERVTFWKKGWSGDHRERHPNQMVMFDAIQWLHQQGYKLFDCAAMNHGTAVSLLKGEPLSDAQRKARDFFLLGYGGTPVLLPESKIYISNPVLRFIYRTAMTGTSGRAFAKCLLAERI